MFGALKRWLFLKALAGIKRTRNPKPTGHQNLMHSVHVLYEYSNDQDNLAVEKFIQYLEKNGKKVTSLMFNRLSQNKNQALGNEYSDKQVGINDVPKSEAVQAFIDKKADVFIVLCHDFYNHMRYITYAHEASLKVGLHFPKGETYFDVLVDMDAASPYGKMIEGIQQTLSVLSRQVQ